MRQGEQKRTKGDLRLWESPTLVFWPPIFVLRISISRCYLKLYRYQISWQAKLWCSNLQQRHWWWILQVPRLWSVALCVDILCLFCKESKAVTSVGRDATTVLKVPHQDDIHERGSPTIRLSSQKLIWVSGKMFLAHSIAPEKLILTFFF